ncbi:hypothetical protein [Hydrogenophaga sp. RWCD_12]|uniref:hypothetical protein n=1 Tax=Hydrogenophaga sp. RWCD_12 TaxID=3391190 RepID=UPI0039848AE6
MGAVATAKSIGQSPIILSCPELPLFRPLLCLSAVAALTACASTEQRWAKEGVSDFDTANFISECKFQTGLAKIKGDQAEELLKHCMQAKGFRLR